MIHRAVCIRTMPTFILLRRLRSLASRTITTLLLCSSDYLYRVCFLLELICTFFWKSVSALFRHGFNNGFENLSHSRQRFRRSHPTRCPSRFRAYRQPPHRRHHRRRNHRLLRLHRRRRILNKRNMMRTRVILLVFGYPSTPTRSSKHSLNSSPFTCSNAKSRCGRRSWRA